MNKPRRKMNVKKLVEMKANEILKEKEFIVYTDILPFFPDFKPDSIRGSLRAMGLQCFKIEQNGKRSINGYRPYKKEEIEKLGKFIPDNYFPYDDWLMPTPIRDNMQKHDYGVRWSKKISRKELNK